MDFILQKSLTIIEVAKLSRSLIMRFYYICVASFNSCDGLFLYGRLYKMICVWILKLIMYFIGFCDVMKLIDSKFTEIACYAQLFTGPTRVPNCATFWAKLFEQLNKVGILTSIMAHTLHFNSYN